MSREFEKLVDACNEVIRLSNKHQVTTPRMISALRKTIEGFQEFINSYDPEEVEVKTPEEAGYSDKNAFERKFVPQEQTILRNSELKQASRDALITQARTLKKVKSSDIPRLRSQELESVKAELERLKADLEQTPKDLPQTLEVKRRARRNWGRVSRLVGGATLIALDTAAAGANPALAPVAAVSVAAGSLVMGR